MKLTSESIPIVYAGVALNGCFPLRLFTAEVVLGAVHIDFEIVREVTSLVDEEPRAGFVEDGDVCSSFVANVSPACFAVFVW